MNHSFRGACAIGVVGALAWAPPCHAKPNDLPAEVTLAFTLKAGTRELVDLLAKLEAIDSPEARCARALVLARSRRTQEFKFADAAADCRATRDAGHLPENLEQLALAPQHSLKRAAGMSTVRLRLAGDITTVGIRLPDESGGGVSERVVYTGSAQVGASQELALDLSLQEKIIYSRAESGDWTEWPMSPFGGAEVVIGYEVQVLPAGLARSLALSIDGTQLDRDPPYLLSPGSHAWSATGFNGEVDEKNAVIPLEAGKQASAQQLAAFAWGDATATSSEGGALAAGFAYASRFIDGRLRLELGAGGLKTRNAWGGLGRAGAQYQLVSFLGIGGVLEPLLADIDTGPLGTDSGRGAGVHFGLHYAAQLRLAFDNDWLGISVLGGGYWLAGQELAAVADTSFFTVGLGFDVRLWSWGS